MKNNKNFEINLYLMLLFKDFDFSEKFRLNNFERSIVHFILLHKRFKYLNERVMPDGEFDEFEFFKNLVIHFKNNMLGTEDESSYQQFIVQRTDKKENRFYPLFFIMKMVDIDDYLISDFLQYHLSKYYNNDMDNFTDFLRLCLRLHHTKLKESQTITVQNWINRNTKKETVKELDSSSDENTIEEEKITTPALTEPVNTENTEPPVIYNELMDINEASKYIHLAKQTVYGLVHAKKIPYYKRERKLYFKRSELEAWIFEKRPTPAADVRAIENIKARRKK